MWPDERIQTMSGIEIPIIQAPMAGSVLGDMVSAVSEAGGLGSLPCAMLGVDAVRAEVQAIRRRTERPINLNFFCHVPPRVDPERDEAWRLRLQRYYTELGAGQADGVAAQGRAPFDEAMCEVVRELRPRVISFHFGLPSPGLVAGAKASGAKILSSATTVREAIWLEERGCDAIIAQGAEAGGHRGTFLGADMAAQIGTMALLPQVVDAVKVPVIAAGGIADARGIVAAFALGAAAVQLGTAYLFCPEAKLVQVHRDALEKATDESTVLTNVFTGRPARGLANRFVREVGPLSAVCPEFPLASRAMAPLRARAEALGSTDFTPLWCGQAARLARRLPAGELTRQLAEEALAQLTSRSRPPTTGSAR